MLHPELCMYDFKKKSVSSMFLLPDLKHCRPAEILKRSVANELNHGKNIYIAYKFFFLKYLCPMEIRIWIRCL